MDLPHFAFYYISAISILCVGHSMQGVMIQEIKGYPLSPRRYGGTPLALYHGEIYFGIDHTCIIDHLKTLLFLTLPRSPTNKLMNLLLLLMTILIILKKWSLRFDYRIM
jgi:hypothetical protein